MPRQNTTRQDGLGHTIYAEDINAVDQYLAWLSKGVWTAAEYGAVGDGLTDDSAKLAAADAAAGPGAACLLAPTANGHRVAVNTTLAAGWHVPPGAKFSVDAGKVLTVNGQPEAGPYQIFTGSGTVSYGPTVVARPEWTAGAGASRWLTLPAGWDQGWRTAKAGIATSPATVAVIGDSILQGVGSSDYYNKGAAALIRAALVARFGSYADFWTLADSAAYLTSVGRTIAGTPPFVVNGSPTWTIGGLGRIAYYNSAFPSPYAWRFTSPYACNRLDAIYCNPYAAAGATFTMAVDGVAQTPVSVPASPTWLMDQAYGVATGTHTLDLLAQSANGVAAVTGVATYSGAAGGIAFSRLVTAGETLNGWGTTSGAIPPDRILGLQGKSQSGTTVYPYGLGIPTEPDLAIVGLGLNDCSTALSDATYSTQLHRVCAALRRGKPNSAILVVIPSFPNAESGDCAPVGFSNSDNWSIFIERMYGVAHAWNAAVFNLHAKWGSTGYGQGFQTATDLHLTDAGHQDLANLVLAVL